MQIKAPLFATTYRLIVSLLAFYTVYAVLSSCGLSGLRLLSFWIMLIAGLYFLISGLHTFFTRTRPETPVFCPVIQGTLIVLGLILLLGWLSNLVFGFQFFTIAAPESFLIYLLLPLLFLCDWLLFSPKGSWTASYPLYWLAVLAAYASLIILTSAFISQNSLLRFPYWFLNYPDSGVDTLLCWSALIASLTLVFGYTFWIIDFALSGELARHVVLPRIKTIVIEEELDEPKSSPLAQKAMVRPAGSAKAQSETQASKVSASVRPQPKTASRTQSKPQSNHVSASSQSQPKSQPNKTDIVSKTPSRPPKTPQNPQKRVTDDSQKSAAKPPKSNIKSSKSHNPNISSAQSAQPSTPLTITNSKDQKSAKNIHGRSHKTPNSENRDHNSAKNSPQPALNSEKSSASRSAATTPEKPSRLGQPAHRADESHSEPKLSDTKISAPKTADNKISDQKPTELKPSDQKSSGLETSNQNPVRTNFSNSKTSESKPLDPKTPASQSSNYPSSEPKASPRSSDSKSLDQKTSDEKSPNPKSSEPKISHFHSSEPGKSNIEASNFSVPKTPNSPDSNTPKSS